MRLTKPVGFVLLLWPTCIALWCAAKGIPDPLLIIIFVAGTLVMRSAGCVANDYSDRHFDKHVQRTAQRPLATGAVSPRAARWLLLGLLLIAFSLVYLLNLKTQLLSVVALLLAMVYPLMKRVTHFPQVVLGCAYAWGIPMAYAAQEKALSLDCWLIFIATVLWTMAYDTEYAMADKPDDRKIGVKSMAIAFGDYDNIAVGILFLCSFFVWCVLGWVLALGSAYFIGVVLAGVLWCYQLWRIRTKNRQVCFEAFLQNQWAGALLFMGTFLGFFLR